MIGHFYELLKHLERNVFRMWADVCSGGALCDETKTATREPAKYRFDGIKGMKLTDDRVC